LKRARREFFPRRALAAAGIAAAVLLACTTGSPRGRAARAPERESRRVVMISFDGVSGTRLTRLMNEPGKLPAGGYARLAKRGFFAERSQPPTPSLTAVSHVTLATGALPQQTGIVSNTILDRMKPFPATISGFDAPIRAETLWEAARRQGKRVGSMLFPGADGKTPARTADWGMVYVTDPIAATKLQTPDGPSWKATDAPERGSFSPGRRLTVSFGKTTHSVTFVALDRTDDGKTNYDRLRVETEVETAAEVAPGDWFPVEVRGEEGRTGAWCKLLSLAPDLSKAEIYIGALFRNAAYPEELRKSLDDRIGFWPGPPDERVFGAGSAHPEVYLEQAERFSDFLTEADLLAIARSDWDLLLLYQPEVDSVEHEFFLADPRQQGYTPEHSARFQRFIDRIYAVADRELDRIERALTPADSLFAVSDHGMTPVWTDISINEVLRQGGFVRLNREGRVDSSSPAIAISHSGIAHIYVNAGAPAGTLDGIERLLSEFRVEGESPWDRILRRQDAWPLGLDAPESGDLIVLTRPGIVFSMRARQGSPIGRPSELGAHGYRNVYPDIDASFVSAGPGIKHERVSQVRNWETAARVSRALGIEPPKDAARVSE
jgi:predicted AlkP superfamily pyrophosphatase or phosphodiesterase